jgi:hypothetical protein
MKSMDTAARVRTAAHRIVTIMIWSHVQTAFSDWRHRLSGVPPQTGSERGPMYACTFRKEPRITGPGRDRSIRAGCRTIVAIRDVRSFLDANISTIPTRTRIEYPMRM